MKDSFRQTNHSLPWRSAFEAPASVVWLLCAVVSLGIVAASSYPPGPLYVVAVISLCFAAVRAFQASEVWNLRINLLGKGMLLTSLASYLDHSGKHSSELWLGKGFRWEKYHSQRLYDVLQADNRHAMPPTWYAKLRGKVFEQQSDDTAGQPWIHGVGDKEEDIHLPFSLLEGNTMIVGTTGSGKSTLLRCIIASCIRRGDCVIVIDPKGDRSLVNTMRNTCALTPGRERDFVYFHTAFPSKSVRYDVLKNFDRVSSLASRISAQIPSKTGFDQFVAFSWRVIYVYSELLVVCGDRPSIGKIRRNVESGVEPLLERALIIYFDHVAPSTWRVDAEKHVKDAKDGKIGKPSRTTRDQLAGLVEYYRVVVAEYASNSSIDSGINLYAHDRSHFGKMISSVMPTLAMLDGGEIGGLLSPKYDDIDDERAIFDSNKIVDACKCIYIGLDALTDNVVSSSIGSIIVADLAAVAGARYNYGSEPRRITLIVDEANEVVSAPFHQLASKGRGSGFTLFVASQTISDYVARLGSEDKALATLGNFNNMFALRVKDKGTMAYVAEQFGTAFVDSRAYGLNTSTQSDASVSAYTGGEAVQVKAQQIEVVPPEILGSLPNHQYFALLAGGRLFKGRQPVLSEQ